jgi:DtxR family transcriptional regulator, Mn-dependent transcriptional regulator
MDYSLAEENYIKAIFHLSENQEEASTNAISEILRTKPASVSDMLRKLSEKDLVIYEKYKGVSLTLEGRRIALQIVRKHRLWEFFLVEKLKFHWDEVHEVAEQLEHIKSPLLTQRLDEFLGFPKHDPHGDPIPDENGELPHDSLHLLTNLSVGSRCIVKAVKDTRAPFLQYLDKIGVHIGTELRVLDKIDYDGSLEVSVDQNRKVLMSKDVSKNILVENAEA